MLQKRKKKEEGDTNSCLMSKSKDMGIWLDTCMDVPFAAGKIGIAYISRSFYEAGNKGQSLPV